MPYFLSEFYENEYYTSGVVRKDMEDILRGMGFTALQFRHKKEGSLFVKLQRLLEAQRMMKPCKRGDVALFHFPVLPRMHWKIFEGLKRKGLTTIALIHDIDGVRDGNADLLQKELTRLAQFDVLIAHNNVMKQWLLERLPGKRVEVLGLFDYLMEEEVENETEIEVENEIEAETDAPATSRLAGQRPTTNNQRLTTNFSIALAANFMKGVYVYALPQLPQTVLFHLYGAHLDTAKLNLPQYPNLIYHGIADPKKLPQLMQGDFGLVWDGASVDTCSGSTGGYLRLNSPHKLSLYLVSGKPVIVWRESALADFVQEQGIGLAVDSLFAMEEQLKTVTVADYAAMVQRARKLGEALRRGKFLQSVIAQYMDDKKRPLQ